MSNLDNTSSMSDKKEKIEYEFYCVAFIDMLGQKEAFLENGKYLDTIEENLSNPDELKKKLTVAHNKTFEAIVAMRKQFQAFFSAYINIASKPPANIPEDKIELFKEDSVISFFLLCKLYKDCKLSLTF